MVVGPFPVAKLGFLLLRTLSKPIANKCKDRAKQSPFFRKYICLPPAHFYNWCEVKTKMWILNLGQPVQVPPLNEAMAIELGANLLGEGILFGVGALVLVIEYRRQAIKQSTKEQEEAEEKEGLNNTIRDLSLQVDVQQTQLRELFRHVYDLESRVLKLPFSLGGKAADGEEMFPKKSDKNSDVITEAFALLFSDKSPNHSKIWGKIKHRGPSQECEVIVFLNGLPVQKLYYKRKVAKSRQASFCCCNE